MKKLLIILFFTTLGTILQAQPAIQNPATIGTASRNQRVAKSLIVEDTIVGDHAYFGEVQVWGLGVGNVVSDANGNLSIGFAPTYNYSLTYAQALDSASNGNLVPNGWYNITSDSIYIQAITDSSFGLNGYYADSTLWELDAIEFDFANRHIQKRCDKRGNCVGSTYSVVQVMGINPIHVFAWGSPNVLGNTVKDAVLDLTGSTDPSVVGNRVLFLSEVTVETEEDFWNNSIVKTSFFAGATSITNNANFDNCDVTLTGGLLNKAVCNDATINLADNVSADGLDITTGSEITASGDAVVTSALLRERSYLEVSDNVLASGIELWENDTIILSDDVNAINIRAYTGADITASGSVFIEGVVIQNVSKFYASGTGSMSPAFICNQAVVTLSGYVDMANNYISSSIVGFTDSVSCQNCWFYGVYDTFNGTQLDTFGYSIYNRSAFYQSLDTDNFQLTNGDQGKNRPLLSNATGNATWSTGLPVYANDAAADADITLPSGGFYRVTGSRIVYEKP